MSPAIGTSFKPYQPYTHRLRKILEEYPDGSQVLREILQNSDDAESTEQIFILDHNTYPSNSLFKPGLKKFQGPALLARNNKYFEDRDFKSLLKLADSEKSDQFDKIGVMGVGFNSIYHITDSPTFITGNNYVILDPHEWYYDGGEKFDFVKNNLVEEYPDQFAPFGIQCNESFKGTLFRYPLRTETDSEISTKIYKPIEILEMFQRFYENKSINSLLFLKYIESISFFELKKGATEPELLYTILLENADEVREKRRLIAKKVGPLMNSLNSGELNGNNQLYTSYIATFCRQKGDSKEKRTCLILNYLDDLLETEVYFQSNFNRSIRDYKFIPNVGLAVPLNDLSAAGRLFCFLPLPIYMPFPVSVHGYFAKIFSKIKDCYCLKDEVLVCFVAPILDYEVTNNNFLKHLKWNLYPDVKIVLKQLEFCRDVAQPRDIKTICNAIYKYMDEMCQSSDETFRREFDFMKQKLENKQWILCENTFYSTDRVFFNLSDEFRSSLFAKLPMDYARTLFNVMGVRNEVGIKDLILIIKNMMMDNEDREFPENEITNVIQILKQISNLLKEGSNPENLNKLLVPSTENKLVKLYQIRFNDLEDRIDENEKNDAKATRFSIIIDEREHDTFKKSLFSEEMKDWQGPAIWIYNDANSNILPLIEHGGYDCAFHITDLPSIVSGKYIAFMDPNAKFLPSPRRNKVVIFDFIETGFKEKLPDQCYPFEAIEGCDFLKEFKGTLLRLPLRTLRLAGQSEISEESFKIRDIMGQFRNVQGNKEILFLKYIESCSLYRIEEQKEAPQMIWQAQINHMLDTSGEMFSRINMPICTNLGVHLNGDFSLSSEGSNILQGDSDAIISVLRNREDFTTDQEYKTYYLDLLVQLLEITYYYDDVERLKGILEDNIIRDRLVNFCNVEQIQNRLIRYEEFKLSNLNNYCEEYIRLNRGLF
ncbi:17359_t:CDS:2 [Funneliformis geosporum]|nr:17359_t:CDS:2 [Funneliformis geosporum]